MSEVFQFGRAWIGGGGDGVSGIPDDTILVKLLRMEGVKERYAVEILESRTTVLKDRQRRVQDGSRDSNVGVSVCWWMVESLSGVRNLRG